MASPEIQESLLDRRVLLGVSGSIAAYKSALLVRLLRKAGAEVQVIMTEDATRFISPLTLGTLSGREVLTDLFPDEASGQSAEDAWTKHVTLGLWADVFVVAPATAQTVAKLAYGFSDSMLTSTALSADCPLLVCPAMDRDMYRHPATQSNLERLRALGYTVMPAEHGELASGLVGQGRLPEPERKRTSTALSILTTTPALASRQISETRPRSKNLLRATRHRTVRGSKIPVCRRLRQRRAVGRTRPRTPILHLRRRRPMTTGPRPCKTRLPGSTSSSPPAPRRSRSTPSA
jgi:phosphopantothenoylcysteine decarboxylase/phosphopantothenate--cysteine ligase